MRVLGLEHDRFLVLYPVCSLLGFPIHQLRLTVHRLVLSSELDNVKAAEYPRLISSRFQGQLLCRMAHRHLGFPIDQEQITLFTTNDSPAFAGEWTLVTEPFVGTLVNDTPLFPKSPDRTAVRR
jgi:hypothetical protein